MHHQKRIVRVAMTETVDAYKSMPESVDELDQLEDRLEDIRRANVEHHLALLDEAASHGVKAICFGELFPGPYFALRTDPMWIALAEDVHDGPTIPALRAAAKRHGIIVVAPIFERAEARCDRAKPRVIAEASFKPVNAAAEAAFEQITVFPDIDGGLDHLQTRTPTPLKFAAPSIGISCLDNLRDPLYCLVRCLAHGRMILCTAC